MKGVTGGEVFDRNLTKVGSGDFIHGITDAQGANILAGGFVSYDEGVILFNAVADSDVNDGEAVLSVHLQHASDGSSGNRCCGWLHGYGIGRGNCGDHWWCGVGDHRWSDRACLAGFGKLAGE